MRNVLFIVALSLLTNTVSAQNVYTIKADSVKLTGCDSAELIIENHTQGIPGFLYNTGHGRTVFKRGVVKINDSMFLIGGDTLKVQNSWSIFGNSGTNSGTNFLGTNDSVALAFKVFTRRAGRITPDGWGTFYGIGAGNSSAAPSNTGIGFSALQANTTGSNNTAMGASALVTNTTGYHNTGAGFGALYHNITGSENTALGYASLAANTAGVYNTAIGTTALDSNLTGHHNTIVGYSSNMINKTGSYNTTLGDSSLVQGLGDLNIAIGHKAGFTTTNGSNNAFFGNNTGSGITTGGYNTILGSNVTGLLPALNNNIILADGRGNRRMNIDSLGNVMFNTTSPLAKNTFSGTGNFSDTLTATTMVNADSSNRVASTAWVKRLGAPTLQRVFNAEPGGSVLTKGDTIKLNGNSFNILANTTESFNLNAALNQNVTTTAGFSNVTGLAMNSINAVYQWPIALTGRTAGTYIGSDHKFLKNTQIVQDPYNSGNARFELGLDAQGEYSGGDTLSITSNTFWPNVMSIVDMGFAGPFANFKVLDGGLAGFSSVLNVNGTPKVVNFADFVSNGTFNNGNQAGDTVVNRYGLYVKDLKSDSGVANAVVMNTYPIYAIGLKDVSYLAGNVIIGGANPPVNNGAKLQVNGSESISTNLGIGGITSMTAKVHIAAGTATAGTAPLKLTPGTVLTSPENGAVEYDGTNYYVTQGTTRYVLSKTLAGQLTTGFSISSLAAFTAVTDILTVTGAQPGDIVSVSANSGASNPASVIITAYITTANTVTIRAYNAGNSTAAIAPDTYKVRIIK
jgi:hypothetical protein